MSSNEITRRSEFLNGLEDLQSKCDISLKSAKNNEKDFKDKCLNFQNSIEFHLNEVLEQVAADNPLFQQMKVFADTIQETNKKWQKHIDNQDTGVRFREGFNDSLMVFIYGKVKSGKSSLGNYVAWGHTDPDETIKTQTPQHLEPIYFSGEKTEVKNGDEHKQAENNKKFRVGATEATSTIQGFSLPGLTWIDSPGLHSQNSENDTLARDYVEHSDLILYTMKSDSPGRASDLKEISELLQKNKPFLILLTGSDETDEEYCAEVDDIVSKTIMKSEERRQSQRDYLNSALKEIDNIKHNVDDIKIISFSARYAQENTHSYEAFQDSGMGQLFDVLEETITSDGVKLKQQAPLKNFQNFLSEFKKDLVKYYNLVDSFSEKFSKMEKDVNINLTRESAKIKKEINSLIRQDFKDILSMDRDNKIQISKHLNILKDKVTKKQKILIDKSLQEVMSEFTQNFGDDVLNVIHTSDIYDLPEFKLETKSVERIISINRGTRKRNSGIGSLLGGLGGLVVGGPVGAIAGATAGGLLGTAVGSSASVSKGDFTVNIGDNLSQVEQEAINNMNALVDAQIDSFRSEIFGKFLTDIKNLTATIKNETKVIDAYFDQRMNSIDLSLEK